MANVKAHRYGAFMLTRIAAIFAVLVTAVAVGLFGISQSSTGTSPAAATQKGGTHPVQTVTICHATGSQSHPYVQLDDVPAFQIAFGIGHGAHTYDIWAGFLFNLHGTVLHVPAHGDQSILRNHCHIPGETPPPTVNPCPTVTVTVTASPSAGRWTESPSPNPQCPTATATTTSTVTATTTATSTATATSTVTGPTSTVTVTLPFVPQTGCPPPNLFNAIRGGRHNDNLVGTPCRDVIAGHNGNDRLFGAAETDIIFGGRGNDFIEGDSGRDILRGGFNDDRINAVDGAPGDRVIGGVGRDVCIIDAGDSARQCERVVRR
jgi:RTX calcium-binding nonapeptide repeat (4 copies)